MGALIGIQTVNVEVTLINLQKIRISIQNNSTINDIKKHIYQHYFSQLKPQQTLLNLSGKKLRSFQRLRDIMAPQRRIFEVNQQKELHLSRNMSTYNQLQRQNMQHQRFLQTKQKKQPNISRKSFSYNQRQREYMQYQINPPQRLVAKNQLQPSHRHKYQMNPYDQIQKNHSIRLSHRNQSQRNNSMRMTHRYFRSITLTQSKAELCETDGLIFDKYKEDQIFAQKGVAYVQCGHFFSRKCMAHYIKYQVQTQKLLEIKCPHLKNDSTICNFPLKKSEYQLIAGLSSSEMQKISENLSENWINKCCKPCPYCKKIVTSLGIKGSRVNCSVCKSKDFCFQCLQQWKSKSQYCQNVTCQQLKKMVANAKLTRKFTYCKKQSKQTIDILVPDCRACPRCRNIIYNHEGCKHTKCPCQNMNYSFCFVCLSLGPPWTCGGYNEYCGKVAPVQKFA